MLEKIILQSNNDIPFIEAQLIIHQPTIQEIALIGEKAFFLGVISWTLIKKNF